MNVTAKHVGYGLGAVGALLVLKWFGVADTAAGALIGAGGVYLTNLANAKEKAIDRDREDQRRNRDREMQLKRDVLLPAVEACSVSAQCVGSLLDLSVLPRDASTAYGKASADLAKVLLVTDPETVAAVMAYTQRIRELWLIAVAERHALDEIRRQHDDVDQAIAHESKMEQEILAVHREKRFNAVPDEAAIANVNQIFNTHHLSKETLLRRRAEIRIAFAEREIQAFSALLNEDGVTDLEVELLRCLRKEIGLPFDAARTRAQSQASRERTNAHFRKRMGEARKMIEISRQILNQTPGTLAGDTELEDAQTPPKATRDSAEGAENGIRRAGP